MEVELKVEFEKILEREQMYVNVCNLSKILFSSELYYHREIVVIE